VRAGRHSARENRYSGVAARVPPQVRGSLGHGEQPQPLPEREAERLQVQRLPAGAQRPAANWEA
jgi:hypothetical protein